MALPVLVREGGRLDQQLLDVQHDRLGRLLDLHVHRLIPEEDEPARIFAAIVYAFRPLPPSGVLSESRRGVVRDGRTASSEAAGHENGTHLSMSTSRLRSYLMGVTFWGRRTRPFALSDAISRASLSSGVGPGHTSSYAGRGRGRRQRFLCL